MPNKPKFFTILDENDREVGEILLPKERVTVISDMLRIYCKYKLIKKQWTQ